MNEPNLDKWFVGFFIKYCGEYNPRSVSKFCMWSQNSPSNFFYQTGIVAPWTLVPQTGFECREAGLDALSSAGTAQKEFLRSEPSTSASASSRQTNCEVFVGGIPTNAPEQEIEQVFGRFGKILACRLMRRQDGASRGFAFITYAIPMSAQYAVSCKNKVRIRGKLVEIRAGLNIHESRKYRAQLQNRKIYIGNLPSNITEDEVRELFGTFGSITEIKLVRDSLQPNSPIYGFVTFEDCETVNEVLNLPVRLHLKGRKIQCKLTIPKEHPTSNVDSEGCYSSDAQSMSNRYVDRAAENCAQSSCNPGELLQTPQQQQMFSGTSKGAPTGKTSIGSGELGKAAADKISRREKWAMIIGTKAPREELENYSFNRAKPAEGAALRYFRSS